MVFARGYPVLGITFLTPISGLETCPDWGGNSGEPEPVSVSVQEMIHGGRVGERPPQSRRLAIRHPE